MATKDEIRLAVPARPEYLRLARVTAAGLASRLGLSFDEVEDLRLAIDELCYGLTGPDGREGMVHVRYLLGDDSLEIEGEAQLLVGTKSTLTDLSEVILETLVDEHEFVDGENGPRFRLVKRRHSSNGDVAGSGEAPAAP